MSSNSQYSFYSLYTIHPSNITYTTVYAVGFVFSIHSTVWLSRNIDVEVFFIEAEQQQSNEKRKIRRARHHQFLSCVRFIYHNCLRIYVKIWKMCVIIGRENIEVNLWNDLKFYQTHSFGRKKDTVKKKKNNSDKKFGFVLCCVWWKVYWFYWWYTSESRNRACICASYGVQYAW